jgi:hypothetical protein
MARNPSTGFSSGSDVRQRFVAVDIQGADGHRFVRHHVDHVLVVLEQLVFAGKFLARHVLEFGAVQADAVAATVQHRHHLFRHLDVAHHRQFEAVLGPGRQVAAAGVEGPAVFKIGFAGFGLGQGLFSWG